MQKYTTRQLDLTPEERVAVLTKALEEIRAAREEVSKEIEGIGWKTVKVKKNWRRSR